MSPDQGWEWGRRMRIYYCFCHPLFGQIKFNQNQKQVAFYYCWTLRVAPLPALSANLCGKSRHYVCVSLSLPFCIDQSVSMQHRKVKQKITWSAPPFQPFHLQRWEGDLTWKVREASSVPVWKGNELRQQCQSSKQHKWSVPAPVLNSCSRLNKKLLCL